MISTKDNLYNKALVEVEVALNCLNIEDYQKIPQDVISAIEENKDENYTYEYNEDLDYEDWEFMSESKAILYNIFKQYLATDEQKQYLIQKERYEYSKSEEQKKKLYNPDNIFKKDDEDSNKNEKNLIEYKESAIKKIFDKIRSIFKNRKRL